MIIAQKLLKIARKMLEIAFKLLKNAQKPLENARKLLQRCFNEPKGTEGPLGIQSIAGVLKPVAIEMVHGGAQRRELKWFMTLPKPSEIIQITREIM